MNITRSITIEAPLETVWKTAAHDFYKVDLWASSVHESKINPAKTSLGEVEKAGRVCNSSFGTVYETFEMYDEEQHTFRYLGEQEKQPPFLKRAANTWKVESISESQSRLIMSLEVKLNSFPGILLHLPMAIQLGRILMLNLEEIKHYIETGKPHPRKVKALSKAAGKLVVKA